MTGGLMLNYSRLRELQRSEMQNAELVKLEDGFYSELKAFLEAREAEARTTQNLLVMKECENVRRIAKALINKRMEKIVLVSIRGRDDVPGLTHEEREFLAKLRDVVKEREAAIINFMEEKKCEDNTDNIKRIKFVKDISPYKGLNEKVYGPYKTGEEAELPAEEAQWLLKEKMAELLR